VSAPLVPETDEARRKRQRRNSIALGLVLAALAIIFYVLTIAKMGPNVFAQRDL
jgi:high-affinity K+ transport system ATPase subunit B